MDIRLKGAKNVRELSEYGLPGYIRAAQLHGLTERDADILVGRYGLRTIIDLRTDRELSEKPDRVIPGVRYLHIPIFNGALPGISHEEEVDQGPASMLPEDMRDLYRAIVTDEFSVGQIRRALKAIDDPTREGAVLWHCTEGKDRCGIISALVLMRHGVDYERVVADYLKTNRVSRRKAYLYYYIIKFGKREPSLAARVRDAFLAKREYMDAIAGILPQLLKLPDAPAK